MAGSGAWVEPRRIPGIALGSGEIYRSGRDGVVSRPSSAECRRSLRLKESSGCDQQVNDLLDCLIGAVISDFEAAVGPMLQIRTMMEAAVGKWAA